MKWLYLAGMVLLLNSCTSTMEFGRKADTPHYQGDCRVFIRGQRTAMPPLPNLSKRRNIDSEELNIIQAEYIKELRDFVTSEREREDAEYYEYIRRCVR